MKHILSFLIIITLLLTSCGAEPTGETYSCTISISCAELIGSEALDPDKRELVPTDGWILAPCEVTFTEGESLFDVLMRVCRENKLHLEYSEVPMYGTAYIEGIANLYEFDAGALSGWIYTVNGVSSSISSSAHTLCDGDTVEWTYTIEGKLQ